MHVEIRVQPNSYFKREGKAGPVWARWEFTHHFSHCAGENLVSGYTASKAGWAGWSLAGSLFL